MYRLPLFYYLFSGFRQILRVAYVFPTIHLCKMWATWWYCLLRFGLQLNSKHILIFRLSFLFFCNLHLGLDLFEFHLSYLLLLLRSDERWINRKQQFIPVMKLIDAYLIINIVAETRSMSNLNFLTIRSLRFISKIIKQLWTMMSDIVFYRLGNLEDRNSSKFLLPAVWITLAKY